MMEKRPEIVRLPSTIVEHRGENAHVHLYTLSTQCGENGRSGAAIVTDEFRAGQRRSDPDAKTRSKRSVSSIKVDDGRPEGSMIASRYGNFGG